MTELTWEGKYDEQGRRVAPLRVTLPFQTIETVNESAQQRQRTLDLFSAGRDSDWRNRLIWGDKKYVLPSLLDEFAGKVNLIYIDPPFNVGADFSFTATIPDDPDTDDDETTSFLKEPSVIEQKAYRDTWGRGMDSYLQWFYETVVMLRELLADDGSIYVHLDWHVVHYAKALMDEIFGTDCFHSEVVWKRADSHNDAHTYGAVHDTILFYSKTDRPIFIPQYVPLSQKTVDSWYRHKEPETGRHYNLGNLVSPHPRPNLTYEYKGIKPPPNGWRISRERMEEYDRKGLLVIVGKTQPTLKVKQYLDESRGRQVTDWWDDISQLRGYSTNQDERINYSTQKPEALLERIIKASSNENDLVLDCFCGSGTTPTVAEKLNRRWIACDLGRFAIHTTRKRLLSIENVRPFVVQNLGKYERQAWQKEAFSGQPSAVDNPQRAYVEFILQLYHARPISGYVWLHGVNRGRMVHVGAVDAPVSVGDVTNIVTEFKKSIGKGKDSPATNGVDILGWDFAFEINEVARQQAAQANVNARFFRIPRDVMDKKAVEQGDIRFFELAALSVDVKKSKRDVTLTLADFVIPPDDVPQDIQKAIKHWSQWIDYWAVDWDNKGDTFHNEWQTYRTRKSPELQKSVTHSYEAPGEYRIMVKVIDILGNDTTKMLKVEVK
ncbi:MAG TPA: site-specific DNA-methyltransferase [Anaerolineae bacterium]|nr:site-specific DNA-methyltransferase [Anaerolineae bacterium]